MKDIRKIASIGSIVLGIIMILGGLVTWTIVRSELADENITVAEDASCLAGQEVNGPFTAYCQAQIIKEHALDASGGLTYAELGREDPARDTAMRASFLRASLFTSVVAFGIAAMAIFMGAIFILIGLGIREDSQHRKEHEHLIEVGELEESTT